MYQVVNKVTSFNWSFTMSLGWEPVLIAFHGWGEWPSREVSCDSSEVTQWIQGTKVSAWRRNQETWMLLIPCSVPKYLPASVQRQLSLLGQMGLLPKKHLPAHWIYGFSLTSLPTAIDSNGKMTQKNRPQYPMGKEKKNTVNHREAMCSSWKQCSWNDLI